MIKYILLLGAAIFYAVIAHDFQSVYHDRVTRVVDADTYVIEAKWSPYDLEWKVRVSGIDSPERGHLAKCEKEKNLQIEASKFVHSLINNKSVVLKNAKHDKWGGRINSEVILEDGRSIGDILLEKGYAKKYNGGGPRPNWCK